MLKRGKGFQVEGGQNLWTMVHVQDLSNVYLHLVEEVVKGGGNAAWGSEGYHFAENGDFVWGDVAKAIAKDTHKRKLIPTAEFDNVTLEEANKLVSRGSYLWGINSRARVLIHERCGKLCIYNRESMICTIFFY